MTALKLFSCEFKLWSLNLLTWNWKLNWVLYTFPWCQTIFNIMVGWSGNLGFIFFPLGPQQTRIATACVHCLFTCFFVSPGSSVHTELHTGGMLLGFFFCISGENCSLTLCVFPTRSWYKVVYFFCHQNRITLFFFFLVKFDQSLSKSHQVPNPGCWELSSVLIWAPWQCFP